MLGIYLTIAEEMERGKYLTLISRSGLIG